jgi:hypothetical protein
LDFALLELRHSVDEVRPLKELKGYLRRLPNGVDSNAANNGRPAGSGRLGLRFPISGETW